MAAAPKYESIAREVRDRITSGDLPAGEVIPLEARIVAEWGVAKATAGRAAALLHSWGVVETVTGKGTRVVERPLSNGPADHTERLRQGQPIYGPGEWPVITEASVISADTLALEVVRALGLPVPDPDVADGAPSVVKRARVLHQGDRVTGLCRTWYPYTLIAQQPRGASVLERLTSVERIRGGTAPVLADLYGLDLDDSRSSTLAGVRRLPPALARELFTDPGTPALWLLVTRTVGEYVLEVDEWWRLEDTVLQS